MSPCFAARAAQHLDLHPRHVDAGRAFAPACLAGDAELHRLRHLVGGERVGTELPGDGEPQCIGAAARDVLLVARRPVGRTHDAAGERAAGAVVVAHLDGALETAADAGIGRPVEHRRHRLAVIAGAVAEIGAVVEVRRPHDLAGIEQAAGIEAVLDLLEGMHQPLAEHRLDGIPSAPARRRARRNASPCIRAPTRTPPRRSRASPPCPCRAAG